MLNEQVCWCLRRNNKKKKEYAVTCWAIVVNEDIIFRASWSLEILIYFDAQYPGLI